MWQVSEGGGQRRGGGWGRMGGPRGCAVPRDRAGRRPLVVLAPEAHPARAEASGPAESGRRRPWLYVA